MAWRKLSILEGNRPSPGSPDRVREAARRAYQHRDRLTELERHLAAAVYHDRVEIDQAAAIQDYQNALRVDPEDPTALNNLGILYQQQDRYAEAGELLERVLRFALRRTGCRVPEPRHQPHLPGPLRFRSRGGREVRSGLSGPSVGDVGAAVDRDDRR
jgi:tetratricopeptide (TPR) repeat protein